jgi:hypothetical protein
MDGSGSDSDSSSSSSACNLDGDALANLQTLEANVAENPFDAMHHVTLIKALQHAGPAQCDQLLSARERMAASLALTPDMWLQWIDDEISVAATPQDLARVEALFERAAADCPSPEVYTAWTNFLERGFEDGDGDAAAVPRVRAVHESALGSMGLNVAAGGRLWDAAIAFERRLLTSANPAAAAAAAEATSKISSLVKRRFSLPLDGMQAAVLALDTPLPADVQPAYNIALNLLAARTRHESQVATGSWEAWIAYAAWEACQGDPSRAHVVHERRHVTHWHSPCVPRRSLTRRLQRAGAAVHGALVASLLRLSLRAEAVRPTPPFSRHMQL